MYYFKDNEGNLFRTKFSPKEISNYILFDCLMENGDSKVMEEYKVNYKSFYYLE
jgi:hypothetical protein